MNGKTPLEVAAALKSDASAALEGATALRRVEGMSKELRLTLGDIEAISHLGNYYAEKILGAAELALYDSSGNGAEKDSAVTHLNAALEHWKRYAAVYSKQYKPQLLNRVGFVDIPGFIPKVENDIAIARAWRPGTIKDASGRPRTGDQPFKK
jgi:hypothetical protein